MQTRRFAERLIFVPFLSLLVACQNPNGTTTIGYEQLGACNGYRDGNTVVSAGANAAFVLFKIHDIDNRNGKTSLPYDPTKLFIVSSDPRAHVSTSLSLAQKIGVLGTTAVSVPAGANLTHNGYAVVVVPTANSPDPQLEANTVNYFFSYETGSGSPGVLLAKKNSSQTQYQGAQNCLAKSW